MLLICLSESALKSKGLKKQLERRILSTISIVLKNKKNMNIKNMGSLLFLEGEFNKKQIEKLSKIAGIEKIIIGKKFNKLEELNKMILNFCKHIKSKIDKKNIKQKQKFSFAIRVKKTKDVLANKKEIEIMFAKIVFSKLMKKIKLDLKNPDFLFSIRMKKNFSFASYKNVKGAGGLPINSSKRINHFMLTSNDVTSAIDLIKKGFSLKLFLPKLNNKESMLLQKKSIEKIKEYHIGKKMFIKYFYLPSKNFKKIYQTFSKIQNLTKENFKKQVFFSFDLNSIIFLKYNFFILPNIVFSNYQLKKRNKKYDVEYKKLIKYAKVKNVSYEMFFKSLFKE